MLGDEARRALVNNPELSGHAVELSRFDVGDEYDLFAALEHDEVWTLVPGRPTDPDHLASVMRAAEGSGRYPWVVRLRRSVSGLPVGQVVGTSSYLDVHPADERCEIGFTAYTPAVWGSVVNAECKLLLIRAAFALGFGRVQLKTDIRNERSQRAIAGLGARQEGVLRRYQRRADGSMRDTVMFSILSEEWPAVRESLEQRVAAALG
jgi:RimJ/RimL family protein N-acetyltransferase